MLNSYLSLAYSLAKSDIKTFMNILQFNFQDVVMFHSIEANNKTIKEFYDIGRFNPTFKPRTM